jgi:hypothetical protein
MPPVLRVVLFVGALCSFIHFIYQIRKMRLQIDYALFWIIFSIMLLVAALVPGIIVSASKLLGFESPANLVFLAINFLLILRLFSVTLKLSRSNEQITRLTQRLALLENRLPSFSKASPDASLAGQPRYRCLEDHGLEQIEYAESVDHADGEQQTRIT